MVFESSIESDMIDMILATSFLDLDVLDTILTPTFLDMDMIPAPPELNLPALVEAVVEVEEDVASVKTEVVDDDESDLESDFGTPTLVEEEAKVVEEEAKVVEEEAKVVEEEAKVVEEEAKVVEANVDFTDRFVITNFNITAFGDLGMTSREELLIEVFWAPCHVVYENGVQMIVKEGVSGSKEVHWKPKYMRVVDLMALMMDTTVLKAHLNLEYNKMEMVDSWKKLVSNFLN